LLDWVALTREAAAAIDPYDKLLFEIVGVNPGSTRFTQLITFLERSIDNVSTAWDDYPHIKKMVVGSAYTLLAASSGAAVATMMAPDVQKVEFSEREIEAQIDMAEKVAVSPAVKAKKEQFYKTIEADPAIQGVGVANDWDEKPHIIVPRSEFSEMSGLWTPDLIISERERVTTDVWDVVLLKASFTSKPQNWMFSRDGLKFNAKMDDAQFLAAVKDGRVPINLQEGVVMRVQVERKEKLDGQVWEPIKGTWRVIKVISPTPAAAPSSLPFSERP